MIFVLVVTFAPFNANSAPLPAIVYNNENGAEQWLDAKMNKLTALHFWATWCKPCIEELPQVNAAQKKYAAQGFKVVALSLDGKNTEKVKKFYHDNKIDNLEVFLDSDMSAFQKLKIHGLPTTIFINSKGEEIYRFEKPLGWESTEVVVIIEKNLK